MSRSSADDEFEAGYRAGYARAKKEYEAHIKELEKRLSDQGWKETRPMFDSYGQYIGEGS